MDDLLEFQSVGHEDVGVLSNNGDQVENLGFSEDLWLVAE